MGIGKDDDLGDVYELLGVEYDAGDKEIQAAYRKKSKTCHPDKNPDDPEAAQKFDRLTRAKDLLLNPTKRADIDRERKAKEELQARFAQEDSKRRKLREDLESREEAAARDRGVASARAESAEEARKRFVQADFAARIKARSAEKAKEQADLVAAAEATSTFSRCEEVSYVNISWREDAVVTEKVIREVLSKFDLKSLDMGELTARAALASREDALRAVLHCRERKHTMPFRVSIANARRGAEDGKPADQGQAGDPAPLPAKARKKAPGAAAPPGRPAKAPSAFGEWEKDMLGDLLNLAAAQKLKKSSPAPATGGEAS